MSFNNVESNVSDTQRTIAESKDSESWNVVSLLEGRQHSLTTRNTNSTESLKLFGSLEITNGSDAFLVAHSDNAEKPPVFSRTGRGSADDQLTKFEKTVSPLNDGTANVEITDPNGNSWKLRVKPTENGAVNDKLSPIIDAAQQLDREGKPTGWALEKRDGKLGLISPLYDGEFQPLEEAKYNDKENRTYLKLKNGDEIRMRNDGSMTRYREGVPINLVDANGNTFKYEWKNGTDKNPTSVFLKPADTKDFYEYRLNAGYISAGGSLNNWGDDNYSLYLNGEPQTSSAIDVPALKVGGGLTLSREARVHVSAHDGNMDGAVRITSSTKGYVEYSLKETSTTWHPDGTKTLNETDYYNFFADKHYPERRLDRKHQLITK
jgi:hypothetical protein